MGVETMIEWLQANITLLVSAAAAVIALFSAVLSRIETRRQTRLQDDNLRHSLDMQSLSWGNASIDTLTRAEMFARTRQHQSNDQSFFRQRVNMLLALSSLIERGRLVFPDPERSGIGAPVIEALHYAYCEIEALTRQGGPTADNSADFISDCRRLVVSELQAQLDPKRKQALAKRSVEQDRIGAADTTVRLNSLAAILKSRRPGINLAARKETVQ